MRSGTHVFYRSFTVTHSSSPDRAYSSVSLPFKLITIYYVLFISPQGPKISRFQDSITLYTNPNPNMCRTGTIRREVWWVSKLTSSISGKLNMCSVFVVLLVMREIPPLTLALAPTLTRTQAGRNREMSLETMPVGEANGFLFDAAENILHERCSACTRTYL